MTAARARLAGAAALAAFALGPAAAAQEAAFAEQQRAFDAMIEARKQGNQEAAKVQAQIDEIADEADAIAAQHRTTLKQVASIRQFNQRMRELIASQEAELASVAEQLNRVDEVGRSVTPLMLRMIDALENFVALDVPFLPKERAERIASLRRTMIRSDVTNATKYRQIMEAYQVENEYGRTIEAYRDEIEIGGQATVVDMLRFGRVALVYQTLDDAHTGVWSQETRSWQELPAGYAPKIDAGVRIARKLEPPDLIEIPLLPPSETGAAAPTPAAAPEAETEAGTQPEPEARPEPEPAS